MGAGASAVATQPRGVHVGCGRGEAGRGEGEGRGGVSPAHPMILECDTAAAPQGTGQVWRTDFTLGHETLVEKLPDVCGKGT